MLFLLLACTTGGGKDSDTAVITVDPTLTNVQAEVFDLSCAFSSCHTGVGAGDLVLDPGSSHGELVGVPSTAATGEILVVAGDPDGSYLVKKLESVDGIVGDPMPPGASLEINRLDLVRAWIAAGAPND